MNKIVTVSREFGSGGRELGRRLAEELGVAYYDQEIITEIAKRTSLSEQYVQSITERKPIVSYPIHVGRSFYRSVNPVLQHNHDIFSEQRRLILELAEKSDCVIVGRCADCILAEQKPFRFFVYADMESRIKRCRERAPEREHFSDRELRQHIREIDRNRAQYYEYYTENKWGDKRNYDLCINTTFTSVKEIAAALARIV